MEVEKVDLDDRVVFKFKGEFRFDDHGIFKKNVLDVIGEPDFPETIVVDIGALNFVDSAGMGQLLILKDKSEELNKKVSIINAQGNVLKIIQASSLDKLFSVGS